MMVTAESYGAVGNGVTDDTAAIQAAIDNNGDVLLDGTYAIHGTLKIRDHDVSLIGNGQLLGLGDSFIIDVWGPVTKLDNIIIEGLTFIGADTKRGLRFAHCRDSIGRDLKFRDFPGGNAMSSWHTEGLYLNNITVRGSGAPNLPSMYLWHNHNFRFSNILVDESNRSGFMLLYSNRGVLNNLIVGPNNGRGIKIAACYDVVGSNIQVNHSLYTGFGITDGTNNCQFTNVRATFNANEGVWFSGQGNHNVIMTNVVSKNNATYDLMFAGTDHDNQIFNFIGNSVQQGGAQNLVNL